MAMPSRRLEYPARLWAARRFLDLVPQSLAYAVDLIVVAATGETEEFILCPVAWRDGQDRVRGP
jgi:hypothetical protein